MKCKECRHENKEEANFCAYCGSKLRDKCNCWVKKKDNYSCGKSSCPGYAIVIAEIKDETEQKARILKLKEDIEKRIARECETIKKAANPRNELAKYVRNIGWTDPEMAALIRKISSNILDSND